MGFPLAPVLANLFTMKRFGWKITRLILVFYFIDVTLKIRLICFFDLERDAILVFDYIDSMNPNIHLTMEKEIDHKIPFLNVLVGNNGF